jgi:hypothetical protein
MHYDTVMKLAKIFPLVFSAFLFASCIPHRIVQNTTRSSPTIQVADTKEPQSLTTAQPRSLREGYSTFESSDKSLTFEYPTYLILTNTTPPDNTYGEHGKYIQTWSVTNGNLQKYTQEYLPANGLKIDFEITEGGENVTVTPSKCEMKATSCKVMEINKHSYLRSEGKLNNGHDFRTYETVSNSRYFKAAMIATPGNNTEAFEKAFEEMMKTFKFTDN